jgi:hypothetical protein
MGGQKNYVHGRTFGSGMVWIHLSDAVVQDAVSDNAKKKRAFVGGPGS